MASVGVKAFELTSGSEADYGRIYEYPETATQTFKKGDPVKLDSAGRVLLGVDTEAPMGVALADASGTTDALVAIQLIDTEQIWTGTTSAAGATADVAQTDIGVECSFIKSTISGSTDITVLDLSDTTTPTMVIVGFDKRDNESAVGATDGRLLFQWLPGTVSTGGIRKLSI